MKNDMNDTKNKDERYKEPEKSRRILGINANQQGIHPQKDIYQDTVNDSGQSITDEIRVEEEQMNEHVEHAKRDDIPHVS